MSAEMLAGIVGTLVDMDLVDLDEPGPWPGEPEGQVAHEVDWAEVLSPSGREDAIAPVVNDRLENLGNEMRRRINKGFHTPPDQVLDAQAWYLPIHYYGPASAIYITEESCLDLAGRILAELPPSRRADLDAIEGCVRTSLSLLYLHEAFHHKVESFAIRLEVVERTRRYLPYHQSVYAPFHRAKSDDLLEEALACAEMYRRLKEPSYTRGVPTDVRSATKALLPKLFKLLPPGYRRAMEFKGDGAFAGAKYLLQSQVHEARLHPVRDEHEWHLGKQMLHGLMNCQSIAHVVVPVGSTPVIPWVGEPLALPQVSTRDVVKLAERRGWKIVPGGGKGSHVKLRCTGRKTLIIPGNRKTVSPGALRTIAAGLGVSAKEIPALL